MATVDDMEKVVEQVAEWAVEIITQVTDSISPDGRPFGFLARTPEEEIAEYMKLRGNPEAWHMYIEGKAQDMIARLTAAMVPPEKIASIRPYEIVLRYVMNWSKDMEKKVEKYLAEGME